jgi:hypothetical protein
VLTTTDASGNILPCTYTLTKGSTGYFAISGNELVTTWSKPVAPGYYSVRVHAMGTTTTFSGSATFVVTVMKAAPPPPPPPPPGVTMTVNGSTTALMVAPGASLTVTVTNGPGNPTDNVRLYDPATAGVYSFKYLATDSVYTSGSGVTSGTVNLTAPASAGNYDVWFVSQGNILATIRLTVSGAAPPPPAPTITVNGSANAVVSGGSALTVTVVNGPGTTTDWLALAVAGSADTSYVTWAYLNGTQTAPSVGVTSASVMMTAPANPG